MTPETPYLLKEIVVPQGLLQVTSSITFDSDKRLQLVNDVLNPGNSYVYGTNGSGVKGWYFNSGGGGGGTVTTASVVSANGFAGSVATATTTPAITLTTSITGLLKGNGTAISAASSGTDYTAGTSGLATGILKNTTGTGVHSIAVAGTDYQAPLVSGTNIRTVNGSTLLGSTDLTVGSVTTTSVVTANGFAGSVSNPTLTPAVTISTTITGLLRGNGTNIAAAVSGTDIKTVNSTTLLGSGDIAVQATLVSATNIKTVNGSSLLGSGDLVIASGWSLTGTSTFTGAVVIDQTTTGTNTLKFLANSLAGVRTDGRGIWLANTTAAAAGAQQWSPSLVLEGQGWKTNATAASQSVKFSIFTGPVQGAANPVGYFYLTSSINGGADTYPLYISDAGDMNIGGTFVTTGVTITGTKLLLFNGTGTIGTDVNSALLFRSNWSSTAGTPFWFHNNATNYTNTAGTISEIAATLSAFTPTSGTGAFNQIILDNTVNQTGGANGQVTWLNAKPTITAAVNVTGYDWNPTTPANITGVHLAFRATAGTSVFGATTGANASVVLGAGTTTIAPLKLTSGTNLTTAVTGCMEYDGTTLTFTRTGTTRESILTGVANVVSPTAPNRTIAVVIAGTTYYIAAKTTND